MYTRTAYLSPIDNIYLYMHRHAKEHHLPHFPFDLTDDVLEHLFDKYDADHNHMMDAGEWREFFLVYLR